MEEQASSPSHSGPSHPCQEGSGRFDDALAQIKALKKIGGTAGMSIGVVQKGETVLEHHLGYAVHERGIVPDSSTRYPLGALTNAFVAVTISELVKEGLMDLDKTIDHYAYNFEFKADPTLAKRLTLRDMLSHNTGLERLDALWLGAANNVNVDKKSRIEICKNLNPVYPPRTKWLYNNWMYALVGTFMGWPSSLEKRVTAKLGLEQTSVTYMEELQQASPYLVGNDADKPLCRTGPVGLTGSSLMSSAAGVRSTLHDMLLWGAALIGSLLGREEEGTAPLNVGEVFSAQSIICRSPGSDTLYTLGFAKVTTPAKLGRTGYNPELLGEEGMPVIGANEPEPRLKALISNEKSPSDESDDEDGGGAALSGPEHPLHEKPTPHADSNVKKDERSPKNENGTNDAPRFGHGRQVFYHNASLPGYNHCFMLIPSLETAIVVLTNSTSHGDTADWAAQVLLQAVLPEVERPKDLTPYAEKAAQAWRGRYDKIKHEIELKCNKSEFSPKPEHESVIGKYHHPTRALYLDVYEDEKEKGSKEKILMFSIGNHAFANQKHVLSYHSEDYSGRTFSFFPSSADEWTRRGLFHYTYPKTWLLSFNMPTFGDGARSVSWVLGGPEDISGDQGGRRDRSVVFVREMQPSSFGAY